MSILVVDASVGIKWFVPENLSVEARRWRNGNDEPHTLAVFFEIESANILWKKMSRGELSHDDGGDILKQLPQLPMTRHAEAALIRPAFELAIATSRSVYDCLYLALAVRLGGRMLTADQRLFNSLSTTAWAANILWVADLTQLQISP